MAMPDHIMVKRNHHGVIDMSTKHHVCDNCNSEFKIKYDESQCESDPIYCPFCSEYMIETDDYGDDDDE